MADCGNRNKVRNIENGVENVMGGEIEEEGCKVVSPKLLEKGSGLLDSILVRESSRADIRVTPKPVVNVNKSGEEPFEEIHRTWAKNLFDNLVEALDFARCCQTSKRTILQLKTEKASSELGQQAWAIRLNECFNVGKGVSTSDNEVGAAEVDLAHLSGLDRCSSGVP
ncbi:hypothetical protein V6N12_023401 [Hibiscus sabdariffa]|uniref:Uncharacterized protein n=1 Tax=Hibiscus sabdariffa TaxID=183260 RepID=A0ABR2FXJ5_9ROSI